MRIGVFVCHCGSNIAGTVDVAAIAKRALSLKDVVHAENIMYTCAEPGQAAIQNAIKDRKLKTPESIDRVVSDIAILSDRGALTDETIQDKISQRFGIPKMTPEIGKELDRLAREIKTAPKGQIRAEATRRE